MSSRSRSLTLFPSPVPAPSSSQAPSTLPTERARLPEAVHAVPPPPLPPDRAAHRQPARELWLALYLPQYMLDALGGATARLSAAPTATPGAAAAASASVPVSEGPRGLAVVDLERGGKVVCACDAVATAAGIGPGMALNSALTLLPELRTRARDTRRERALLDAVAAMALDFTPRATLEPPDAVLLEVRGSLRLFGGLPGLGRQIRERLQSAGIAPQLALAPTALAALWLVRSGSESAIRRPDALRARLAPLPLACTRWSGPTLEALATMGVRTVGDCLKLPRDGFARRFEPRMRLELDRALGLAPDPRPAFVPNQRFTARRDLEPEESDAGRLHRALEPLFDELCRFLRGRGQGVQALELRLLHRDATATRLRLRFAEPVTEAGRIALLLRERLARTGLPAPVRSVRLRSGPLTAVRMQSADLFVLDRRRTTALPQLVERLRARLGAEAVHGLCLVAEHRPEATQKNGDIPLFSGQCSRKEECPHFSRPVWLLAGPQPLDSPFEIEDGPERIESGWWDGRDVRRDYYVARNPAGMRLWVFRERRAEGGWFLHGVFG